MRTLLVGAAVLVLSWGCDDGATKRKKGGASADAKNETGEPSPAGSETDDNVVAGDTGNDAASPTEVAPEAGEDATEVETDGVETDGGETDGGETDGEEQSESLVTVNVLSFANPSAGAGFPLDQLLTTNLIERDALLAAGWTNDRTFKIHQNSGSDWLPIYRCRSTTTGDDHHFTTKTSACDGHVMEGLLGYAQKNTSADFVGRYHGCEVQNSFPHAVRVAKIDEPCSLAAGYTIVDTDFLGYVKK